ASSMSIYGEGAYSCDNCGVIQPNLRPLSQLLERDWELKCPKCGLKVKPVPTNEDKPLFPSSVYAISKQDQEQFCLVVGRAYEIPVVALRYFNVYGPRQALSNPYTGVCAIFSGRLLNDQAPMVFEDGEQTRDFVHVSDIVQANLLALETDRANYQTLNIGTGSPISITDIALMLARGLNKDLRPEITGKYREGDIRHCVADISRARTLLGYEPKVTLADGIPELLDWVRQQQAAEKTQITELEQHQLVR
ncbi:MAG TPA: NAD-dependent epimerase/dehydratase family protein, partial [Pyrinomonadaceae bacterium]